MAKAVDAGGLVHTPCTRLKTLQRAVNVFDAWCTYAVDSGTDKKNDDDSLIH